MTTEQGLQNGLAMLAYYNGKPVQSRCLRQAPNLEWVETNGLWYFDSYEYRPKPEPVTRPWASPADVPGPVCWLKFANDSWGETMILGVRPRGVTLANINHEPGLTFMEWSHLESKYTLHSTDRKTWKPCTVEEPA